MLQTTEGGGFIATGNTVYFVSAIIMAKTLEIYARTGMKPNRRWAPKAMMLRARRITGKKFPLRDYEGAARALRAWAQAAHLADEAKQALDEGHEH